MRTWSRSPWTWYAVCVVSTFVVVSAANLSPLPKDLSQAIGWSAAALISLPLAVAAVAVAASPHVRLTSQRSRLASLMLWATRLLWTALTFALGAYVATLVSSDLEGVASSESTNGYLYRFFALVLAAVAPFAVGGVVVAAGWIFFTTGTANRSRALLRAVTLRATRESLPLYTRMWLDNDDDVPMPGLASHPRRELLIRDLASDFASPIVLGGAVILMLALLAGVPTAIAWVSS